MWAIQHSKVVPDMLTWGKGMGGDKPITGVTYRSDIEASLREGSQPSTFAGNAMACEVSMTNIDIITDPRMDLLGRAAALGEEIKGMFTDAMPNVPVIGDVRGNGPWSASRSWPTARPRSRWPARRSARSPSSCSTAASS